LTPAQISEVWGMLDREQLAAIAHRGPEPVFATISGAHLYGFASPDSDVDLRGAFLLPAADLLGLRPPHETITIVEQTPIDLDWVAHDLRKLARMLVAHNGYVLEQVFSPLVVIATPVFEELRELSRGCVTRPTVRHYQGFARGRRARLRESGATVKHLLYAYRVLLTGIHMMRTGEVVSHLPVLAEGRAEVEALVARKREGAEAMQLDVAELAHHEAALDRLMDDLVAAHAASHLPDVPTTFGAIDALVVRARLDAERR
jgi:predicted nucleotidyltransferase